MGLSSSIERTDPPAWSEPGVGPNELETLRLLLNTDNRFMRRDYLREPQTVDTALDQLGIGPTPLADDDLAELVAFRDAVRTLTEGDARWDLIEGFAERHPVRLHLGAHHRGLVGGDAIGTMLAMLFASLEHGTWQRLKHCANPDCQWTYYDGSKNRSGRWCSMTECGEVMKARAYRARKKSE